MTDKIINLKELEMSRYRGRYIDRDGLKWIEGEGSQVDIQKEIYTADICGQYVIWSSLEELTTDENGNEVWVKCNFD